MENSKNNNNEDLIEGKKTLKIKIFDYFFNMLILQKTKSYITFFVFHSIEIIQLISLSFSPPHTLTWNIPEKKFQILYFCISGFRLTPLLYFTSFNAYSIIFYGGLVITLGILIFLIIQILFRKQNSKIYIRFLSFTQILIFPLTTIFFIPFIELFLISFKCEENDYTRIISWGKYKCWSSPHYTFVIFGIIGAISYSILIIFLNYYYFYPFFIDESTTRLSPIVDIFLVIIKIIFIIQYIFIKNDYASIIILLLLSSFLLYFQFLEPAYNINCFEIFLNMRNILAFWSYFVLLFARICLGTNTNNIIYLLIFGYPLVVYCLIVFFKNYENRIAYTDIGFNNNVNSCMSNIKFFLRLITTFIKEHSKNFNYQNKSHQHDLLILKGMIENHSHSCIREDCPLTKFIINEGNFMVQKQSLLNYMSSIFNNSMKAFPNNILIKIYCVQFYYDHSYNLSSIKPIYDDMKSLNASYLNQYVIYCQNIYINNMKIIADNKNEEQEQTDKLILEQKFLQIKNFISNATKIYAEFWGIFESKVTNNLNTQKLYKLGEKLNIYLKKMNNLWDNELKNKKLSCENEPIAQLYALFLKEILWDKKRSEAVQKKINEEHNMQDYNNAQDDNKIKFNLNFLENPNYIMYIKANDKGNCILIQFSNSLSYIIGYQKHEILNKSFDLLLPAIFVESFKQDIEDNIKQFSNIKDEENYNIKEEDKSKSFILIKNKMGYIHPFFAKILVNVDNDFSDSFLVQLNLEEVDTKSMYAYYILSRPDFTIESISSSAIHLGLTMDLLKKYVINLNILIRTNNNNALNLFEKSNTFENSERKITWVYPDIIYPKNDNAKNKNKSIQDLIKVSNKNKFFLQIFTFKNQKDEINGFIFKIYESKSIKQNHEKLKNKFIPSSKNQIIFDLLNLKYIRTAIVNKKTGLRNLRESEDKSEKENKEEKNIKYKSKRSNIKTKEIIKEKGSSDDDDELIENKITKEKILELQTKNSNEIKLFINSLSFYGKEISLIKHRPNREKYPTGKAQEPLIKISISIFIKTILLRIKQNPNFLKRIKKVSKNIDEQVKVNIMNSNNKMNLPPKDINKDKSDDNDNDKDNEKINKDLSGDHNLTIKNIINANNLVKLKVLDFLIFLFIILITIFEFLLTNNFLNEHKIRYSYYGYSYDILKSLVYIKYFLTEGLLTVNLSNYTVSIPNPDLYFESIKEELSTYHKQLSKIFNIFNNPEVPLSTDYTIYKNEIKLEIKTLFSGNKKIEYQPLSGSQTKLINALSYISNSAANKNIYTLNNIYIYELSMNLLTSHLEAYKDIINFMLDDFKMSAKDAQIKNIIFLSVSLAICTLFLISFLKYMINLDNSREKPINLFLTIKNKVFEDLKDSAEKFSNKLLNNFFGVDENEEESQQNYRINVEPNDINIAKYKALSEFKEKNNKGYSFLFYYIQIIIFMIIFNILLIYKYLKSINYYYNIADLITVYDSTRLSEIQIMSRIDIIKEYLFNTTIINNEIIDNNNINKMIFGFCTITEKFEDTIKETSQTKKFLKDKYKNDFFEYFYNNANKLINNKNARLQGYTSLGFKTITLQIFEMLRILYIKYFIDSQNYINYESILNIINDSRFSFIDVSLKNYYRPWFTSIAELIDSYFCSFVDYQKNIYIFLFAFMLFCIVIFYWIIWKRYEEEFSNKIEKSLDLINLIPEEIKSIIVDKLNDNIN